MSIPDNLVQLQPKMIHWNDLFKDNPDSKLDSKSTENPSILCNLQDLNLQNEYSGNHFYENYQEIYYLFAYCEMQLKLA